MTDKEKDYTAVLLEDVNSNMQAYWEVLSDVKSKSDATFEEVGRINERLTSVEVKLDLLIEEVAMIKNEIRELKTSLSKKADLDKLEVLELRVTKIEKHFKLTA